MSYYMTATLAYKVLTGEISRQQLFEMAINDSKTAIALLEHSSTSKEERQRIMVKNTKMSDYADLLKKGKLTEKEEEYLLTVAFSNSGDNVISYLEYKRRVKSDIQTKIVKFFMNHSQSGYALIGRNRAFSKLSEENQKKIYEAVAKDNRYAANLLRDKPDNPYRNIAFETTIKTGEGAWKVFYDPKRYKLTREEEDRCIAKMATLKSYLSPLLNQKGINLWKEQYDIIVDAVVEKQSLELIKIVWDMGTLTPEQKAKLEPFMVAQRLLKAK